MFRRSRLSIRPNVATSGRAAGSSQETSSNTDQDNTNIESHVSVDDNKSADPPTEQTPGIDQNGEAASSSAIQRRKRFSVRPKVVPGRPSALPRTPKSPIKPVIPSVKSPVPVINKTDILIEADRTAPLQELLTPKECQPSNEIRLSKIDSVSPSECSSKCLDQPSKLQSSSCSQIKEISPKAPVPPSIPDREAIDISEKAKTLVSKTELKTSSQHFSLTQLLNDKSDLLRLEKARKLRQLLKQEMLKEKSKKYIARVKEYTLDPSKMTMRDLIHYLPTSNPMLSTLEESALENETVIPQSPEREASPERAQELEVHPKMLSPGQEEATATTLVEGEQDREEEEAEEAAEDEEALMVPQVKVAEDGSLIIDEESLTVEVQRMKGPNPIQDRDPIFERGSTTTYSSFRKGTHTKPWSTEETDMFFLAISMVGTDFAMISQLFPHRARSEIKNKFKKEERHNAWRIDKAFRERRRLDLEYFKKLLEKILENQQNKKKLKSTSEKPKTSKRKTKVKKAVVELSDVDEQNEDGVSIEEQEGEKENLCNDKTSSSKTKGKRKCKDVLSSESPVDKKRNKRENKKMPDDAGALADLEEVAIPEDHLSLDQTKRTETQPAKSGKSLPLGRKGRKAKKSKAVVSDTEGETTSEETVGQQSTKRMSDNDSSNHETTVQSTKPSRYGRISKPVQPLNYPTKEDTNSSASDTLASPAHQTAAAKAKNKTNGKRKRSAQQKTEKESKKPKLITLRASQSEGSDDDDEEETDGQHYDDENSTSAFVPASLCSPKPVVPEVQETMEELDMLAHMPDVLGMSKNALCPNASCEQVQNERGTVEPCEHQLDLLVDVIDFLSEHTEASGDESYNEAAQTLLEIGNLANLAQPTESQPSLSDHISKFESSPCSEVNDLTKSLFEQEECTALISEASKTENIPTNRPIEQPSPSFASDTQVCKPSGELSNTEEPGLSTQVSAQTAKNSLPTRKGRLSKIKPKPNVGSSTRTTKQLTQSVGGVMKSQGVDIAATSQHQNLGQLEESTPAVSETDHGPADDTTIMSPISHASNIQVSHEPCCKQDTVDSPQLQTTPEPKINSSPPRLSKINPSISCALRTTKQTVEAVEENPQVESEIPSTTQFRSLEHQEEPTLSVLEQNESCSPQGTAATQLEPLCAKNSPSPRKGRLSKIKPKPNIGCASRSKKLSPQIVHAIEDKIQDESEIASTSQCGSSEHQVESTQTLSEQSNSKSTNEADDTTENLPVSQSSDTQVIKHCDEPSSTLETALISQLETPSSKNSTPPRTERFSKIKAKPNIASSTTKPFSQSVDIIEEKQTADKTATASQLQSVALPLSESEEGSCVDFSKGTEADQSNRIVLTCSEKQEPGEEPSTLEKHLGQFAEMSCTPSVPCAVEPLEQARPFENVTSLEPEIISSTQNDHSSAEEKTEKITCVKLSDSSSESLKHSTPQRRRWIPKIKPKPNLASSLRTANSRSESKDIAQASDHIAKSSLLNTISEQPVLQDSSTANVAAEPNSASTDPLMLGISLGEETTNVSETDKIHEDPAKVQEPCELSAANQTNMDHCGFTDCAPFVSSKSNKTQHQLEDLTLKNTEIYAISNFHVETCEISSDHIRPVESAVEPSTELQHNDVAPALSPGQMQDSSVQNSFEYKSLLFPNIPPDQVPSDPDEPFFILSLTEIPVCPSGEEVNPRPESYHALPDTKAQQSNPVEPVVPLAAGIDDSLSNIHIPTPEKATLKSELICVEQYLPSAPSVDISLLEEPQENSSVQRLNLTESGSNIEHSDTLSADKQPSIRDDVKKSSRRQNLTGKTAAKKINKHEDTAQDPPEPFTQIKSEVVDSQAQQDSDGSSRISKIKTYEARGNKSRTKNSKASGDPVWGGTEVHSSEEQTANVLSCSFSSKDNQSTSSSSELLDPNQSDSTNVLDEGPTDVLEYFFGDVFTEVESDCSVTGNITGDAACCDKTQSQPAETKVNLRQHSNTPCGQQSPITAAPQKQEATADEATSSNLPGSSVTEATSDSNQQDNRKSRGRGKGNTKRKNKTSGEVKSENSRPQRKSAATNFPQELFQDNLKESTSSSSSIPPQTRETSHCSSLQNTSEILDSNQSNSVGSSNLEEEPTNVSQYFFTDVFTEVESNDFSVQEKPNSNSPCSSSAPSQKVETKVDERDKRKVSSDPRSGQHSALTEGQPPDATPLTNLQNTPSSIDVTTTESSQRDAKMTRGKGSSKKKSNICEPLRSLRKSTEALKTPETVLQDSLIETQSTSSAVRPENLRGSLCGSTEVTLLQNYPAVDIDCGHSSVTGTANDDDACGETQSQTSETSGKTRKKRQAKASSGPLLLQEPAHEVTPEAQKTTVDPSHDKKERGKGRFNRKNKPSDGATAKCSQPQRQNTAASKSPARVKEELSANASTAQVELEGTNISDIKESSPFDDEPTNVSQFFLSDIFTDVDEEFK